MLSVIGAAVLAAIGIVGMKLQDWLPSEEAGTEDRLTYDKVIFDKNKVLSIDITLAETDWNAMLEAPLDKTYYPCSITINGETFTNVGIATKGNSSLKRVAEEPDLNRYGFKISFGHFVKGQTCHGLDKLLLNANYADATYMKEYISYDLHTRMGVPTPLFSYADLKINGQLRGLYLAVEDIEESFILRNFGKTEGQLYKPSYLKGESFYAGADLSYQGDDSSKYETILNSAQLGTASQEDAQKLIASLKHLEEQTELETYVAVDSTLRMLAVNAFIMNDDCYFGDQIHNYYIYEKGNCLTMLPWDYNLAFGGYTNPAKAITASDLVNRPLDSVTPFGSWEKRPLVKRLLSVEEYKTTYHTYTKQILQDYFEAGVFEAEIDRLQTLIDSYVKAQTETFYPYEQFLQATAMLKKTGMRRAESVAKQFSGELGITHAEQIGQQEKLVDTGDIDLKLMGHYWDFGAAYDTE